MMTRPLYSEKQIREADRLIRTATRARLIDRALDVLIYGSLTGGAILIVALMIR